MRCEMKRDADKTRQALLDAAEKLMTQCDDPASVTARAITKEANVNLAMINYFFGSREGLIFEVFSRLQKEAAENDPQFGEILCGDMPPKEKLKEIHFKSMKLMLENFSYCRALTKYILINRSIGGERGSVPFIEEHFQGRRTEGECRLIAFELSSLHELAVLRKDELRDICGIDLTDDEVLRRYVEDNVERFLGE
ncbi:MAG: TetR/AcrR family transcriptional regulator [Oscillospiraceae bacterium]|nr:TetR/AcrR family transcriptional regulator [Oscillospiraceae bacterium]